MSKSWRDVARERIEIALLEYEAECLCSGEAMELKAWKKRLTEAYPFYERENHPYKIWLNECKFAKKYFEAVARGDAQARHYSQASEADMHRRKCKSMPRRKRKSMPRPVDGQLSLI